MEGLGLKVLGFGEFGGSGLLVFWRAQLTTITWEHDSQTTGGGEGVGEQKNFGFEPERLLTLKILIVGLDG